MSRHGPRPAALAPRVGLAYLQHSSAPGALKKKISLEGERQRTAGGLLPSSFLASRRSWV